MAKATRKEHVYKNWHEFHVNSMLYSILLENSNTLDGVHKSMAYADNWSKLIEMLYGRFEIFYEEKKNIIHLKIY